MSTIAEPTTVSVDLPIGVALELLIARGWGICLGGGGYGPGRSFTRPGRKPRSSGGKCGPDYLWALDEALTIALATA